MEESIRTFIALTLSDELKNRLKQVQDRLRLSNADVKWTPPEGIHLTLKFLGNIRVSQIDDICSSVAETAGNFSPFSISLSSVGAFPNVTRPQIIWVGIDEGREMICKLNQQIEDRLTILGFEKEKKRFSPHLTIGRVKGQKGLPVPAIVEVPAERMTISAVHMMKSQLSPQGAIHSVLKEIPLQQGYKL